MDKNVFDKCFNAPKGWIYFLSATSTVIIPYFLDINPYMAYLSHSGRLILYKKLRVARKFCELAPIYRGWNKFLPLYMGVRRIYFRVTRIPSQPPESPGIFSKTGPVSNNEHILFHQNLYPTNHFCFALTRFTQSIIPHMICFWAN